MANKFATIHSGLLARKGEAMPAMSSHLAVYTDGPPPTAGGDTGAGRRDVAQPEGLPLIATKTHDEPWFGRREPGDDTPVRLAAPFVAEVDGRAETAGEHPHGHGNRPPGGRYKLTLRLDVERRRRLRIVAAQHDRSLQRVLVDALDKYLDGLCACSMKDCACLAPRREAEAVKAKQTA